MLANTSFLVTKSTFVVTEIRFKEAVITFSVVKNIYVVGEITFKVAVMTSLGAKFTCLWPRSSL